jgi:NADH-quinone oxidoreductase subunit I
MKLAKQWQNLAQSAKAMRIVLKHAFTPIDNPKADLPFRGCPTLWRDDDGRTQCTSCGVCAGECPTQCILLDPFCVDEKRCIYCGLCATVCPEQALEISNAIAIDRRNLQ